MIANFPIGRLFERRAFAPISYVIVVLALSLTALFALMNVLDRYHARDTSLETLSRLRERANGVSHTSIGAEGFAEGSPFLEGHTITLASAALLQRLSNAISKAGGSIISTEIEPRGAQPGDWYLRATATCELNQRAVQQLLYEVESAVPFLLVDQLLILPATGATPDERMRLQLTVSAMWLGAK